MTSTFGGRVRAVALAAVLVAVALLTGPSHAGRTVVAQGTSSRLTIPLVMANKDYVSAHRFGVQMYGSLDDAAIGYKPLRTARPYFVRWEVSWKAIVGDTRTVPPVYTWYTDADLERARQLGLNPIVTFVTNPEWASERSGSGIPYLNGPIREDCLADFAAMVAAMARRYPWITYYEFFNEPDNAGVLQAEAGGPYWGPYGDRYAAMLAKVYPALKAANPRAKVVLGGLAYDAFSGEDGRDPDEGFNRQFLTDVLAHGGGQSFDVFNFHYYPAFAPSWEESAEGRDLVAKVNHLRQVLADHGCADKPFFCTEVGAPSGPTPFYDPAPTQESQARYVTQVAARAVAARLDAMIWFAWKDFTDNAMYEHYGLVTSTRVEKSSVLAFRTATLKLGSATFVRTLDFPGVEAYEFRTPSGATLVTLWSDDGLSRTVTLQAARATLTDMYGTPQGEVTDAGDGTADGQIVVTAGANPLYVEIPHAQ
ncbi:MAG: hypothetical protein GX657_07950 [Chloroflexi bacterium]|nr:hypothetical protein [Chloroflexota bacterium]